MLIVAVVSGCSEPPVPVASGPQKAIEPERITHVPEVDIAVSPVQVPGVILDWQVPVASLEPEHWPEARAAVRKALQDGHIYRDASSALPMLLAMKDMRPNDRWVGDQLRRVRRVLEQEFNEALLAPEHQQQALQRAQQSMAALMAVTDSESAIAAYRLEFEQAQQRLMLNRRAETALSTGQLGVAGDGALADFQAVLAQWPDDARALQGIAAVESALLRRALSLADRGDFVAAMTALEQAAALRPSEPTVAWARGQVEQRRDAQVTALLRAAQSDIQVAAGLKQAAQRLQRMLQIALADDVRPQLLAQDIARATRYGVFAPGQVLRDGLAIGGFGPEMVVIPHGQFVMGAPEDEPGATEAEMPQHVVRFERGFAIGMTEVTVGQFRQFVESSGARPRATRRGHSSIYELRTGNFIRRSGVDWRNGYDGVLADDDDPVMHVSVRDAEAYAAWLSEQTGEHYRLPSESEFEYVLRAGIAARYPWGSEAVPPAEVGNLTGSEDVSPTDKQWTNAFLGYGDGWWGPAPVASFLPNGWGVHDMSGNLSEWVADCWHANYRRAPADGAAWYNPGCRQRVVRGANWANSPVQSRAAWRWRQESDVTSARIGFRLVRGI